MSSKATQKLGNKESDRLANAGTSTLYKVKKERSEIRNALDDENTLEAVRAYIFSKDPEAINPLQEIRDANL